MKNEKWKMKNENSFFFKKIQPVQSHFKPTGNEFWNVLDQSLMKFWTKFLLKCDTLQVYVQVQISFPLCFPFFAHCHLELKNFNDFFQWRVLLFRKIFNRVFCFDLYSRWFGLAEIAGALERHDQYSDRSGRAVAIRDTNPCRGKDEVQ